MTAKEAYNYSKKHPEAVFLDTAKDQWTWEDKSGRYTFSYYSNEKSAIAEAKKYEPFILVHEWTILHPYEFMEKVPADRSAYEWEYWGVGDGWTTTNARMVCDDGITYRYRPKKKTKTVVKDPAALMRALIDAGYEVSDEGRWFGPSHMFTAEMWQYCGKEPDDDYLWNPEWLTEVEE